MIRPLSGIGPAVFLICGAVIGAGAKRPRRSVAVHAMVLAASFALALVSAVPATASSVTSVTDPVGDASIHPQGILVPGYQDIVRASVTGGDGRFVFVMDLAAPVPAVPTLQPEVKLLDWSFRLNTDVTTAPRGFPWAPGDSIHGAEFVIFIVYDGTSFSGILIDRTPTLGGGQPVITPISFAIRGSEITASVPEGLIGTPSSFLWRATTDLWVAQLGTEAFWQPDSAPDTGSVAWP